MTDQIYFKGQWHQYKWTRQAGTLDSFGTHREPADSFTCGGSGAAFDHMSACFGLEASDWTCLPHLESSTLLLQSEWKWINYVSFSFSTSPFTMKNKPFALWYFSIQRKVWKKCGVPVSSFLILKSYNLTKLKGFCPNWEFSTAGIVIN